MRLDAAVGKPPAAIGQFTKILVPLLLNLPAEQFVVEGLCLRRRRIGASPHRPPPAPRDGSNSKRSASPPCAGLFRRAVISETFNLTSMDGGHDVPSSNQTDLCRGVRATMQEGAVTTTG